jgi:hypothetical protein
MKRRNRKTSVRNKAFEFVEAAVKFAKSVRRLVDRIFRSSTISNMRPISLMRFNALAAYCRRPEIILYSEELKWFEHSGERVLGVLMRDYADGDFGGQILGRDARGRFRWIGAGEFNLSQLRAEFSLRREMERLAAEPDEEFRQGDERGESLDFFKPQVPDGKLNSNFRQLSDGEGFSPARGIIEPMMHWYEDLDGNYVQQFQTTGFDARIWELYLFATFVEMGFAIERIHAIPDFSCAGLLGEFCVEAVTVNPTQTKGGGTVASPPTSTPEEIRIFQKEYMPIKYAGALTSKLAKRYWEKPSVAGKPLLFAIHDFHAPMSMIYTRSALPIYLYGYDWDWSYDKDNTLRIQPRKVASHNWSHKKDIPSGFFNLEGSENISAVVFSNSGTISKFNRMGLLAGFGSGHVKMIRIGTAFNHDPNAVEPLKFKQSVNDPNYRETWTEGLDIYHNPNALHPIPLELLPGAVHHQLQTSGQMLSTGPDWQPLGSITLISLQKETQSAS